MLDFSTSIPSSGTSPGVDTRVGFGGTSAPFIVHRFWSGHIAPSTLFVGVFFPPSSRLDSNSRVHSLWGDSGCMNVGATSYIPYYVPSPTILVLYT